MKRQELRACFDRIQPREELIRSTLSRVHAAQEERPTPASSGYSFMMRLAGAACALVLLIGIGVSLGKDAITAPDVLPASDERMTPMAVGDEREGQDKTPTADAAVLVGCEQMVEQAKSYASDWMVCSAMVDAVYFKSETEGVATLRPQTLADGSANDFSADDELTVVAAFDASDDALGAMVDQMGSEVLVGLHVETRDGESVWVIHEMHVPETPVE